MSAPDTAAPALARTPLHNLHVELGGRMVPFAGYEMPVQFPAGILKEHLHTRSAAGLFDVSHMGQIALRPRSGRTGMPHWRWSRSPVDVLGLATVANATPSSPMRAAAFSTTSWSQTAATTWR